MAIALVQDKTTVALLNDQTATLDAPATNGNILIVVGMIASNTQTMSVTDNVGTMTWQSAVSRVHSASQVSVEIFWGIVAGAPTVITMNSSSTATTTLHVVEVSGLHATPVDGTATGESTTTSETHNVDSTITPSQADVLLVGGIASNNAADFTPPGSFALIDVVSTRAMGATDIVSSIAAYDFATVSTPTVELTVSVLAAFKMASGIERRWILGTH